MSRLELNAWAMLAGLGAVFAWFSMRMLDGWTVPDQSPGKLLWTYLVVITLSTIVAGVIGALTLRGAAGDERDRAIAARANLNERIFIIAGVNVVIWQALWEALANESLREHRLPQFDLTHLPTLFYGLFALLFLGEFVRLGSMIVLYRVQSARG